MGVLFFVLIEMLILLVAAVSRTVALVKLVSALISVFASLPMARDALRGNLETIKNVDSAALVQAAYQVAGNKILRPLVGQSLRDVALLELDREGRVRDLFNPWSVYNGIAITELMEVGHKDKGAPLPILFVKASQVRPGIKIESPGPIYVYGEGKVSLDVRSGMAILFGNEKIIGRGTVLDAPLVVISKLVDDNGIALKNSKSETNSLKLVEFAELRTLATQMVTKAIKGEPLFDADFDLDDLAQDVPVTPPEAEPKGESPSVWKRFSLSYGFFFLRAHLRFGAPEIQNFIDQIAESFAAQQVTILGLKVDLHIVAPRLVMENGKLVIKATVNLRNDATGFKATVRDLEVEVTKVRVDKLFGYVFIDQIAIRDFKIESGDWKSANLAGFKPAVKAALNQVVPRLLRTRKLFDLRKIPFFGVSLARFFFESISVEPDTDVLQIRFRIGPRFRKSTRACAADLTEI